MAYSYEYERGGGVNCRQSSRPSRTHVLPAHSMGTLSFVTPIRMSQRGMLGDSSIRIVKRPCGVRYCLVVDTVQEPCCAGHVGSTWALPFPSQPYAPLVLLEEISSLSRVIYAWRHTVE